MTTNSSLDFTVDPATKAFQLSLCLVLLGASLIGNGLICLLVLRFKALRTVPNIFLANIAFIDIATTIAVLPTFIAYFLFQDENFSNRTASWVITFFNIFFYYWSLTTMFIMVVDRYLAIAHTMRYNAWKSTKKAIFAIVITLIIAFIAALITTAPLYEIDLGKKSVLFYRSSYSTRSKYRYSFVPTMIILLVLIAIASGKTLRAIWKNRIRVNDANKLRKSISKKEDSAPRSALTVLMILLSYIVCHMIGLYFMLSADTGTMDKKSQWFYFFAHCMFFVSSSCNAFICTFRSMRFRQALKKILNGCSPIFRKRNGNSRNAVHPSRNEQQFLQVFYVNGTFGKEQIRA